MERHEPEADKIVVTSRGVQLGTPVDVTEVGGRPHREHVMPAPWTVLDGEEPFVFARNANLGMRAAAPADVLLVNDDVQFTRPNTLRDLGDIARQHPDVGILSPQFLGQVGNGLQSTRTGLCKRLTYSRERLAFTCVLIRREVLERVGYLDERFTGYGSEDDDYCWRVQRAGYKLGVTPEVIVRHGFGHLNATASYARTHGDVRASAQRMYQLFCAKQQEKACS